MNGLLICTEAGDDIGFGHYTRCSAIQEFFLQKGVHTFLLLDMKGQYDLHPASGTKENWLENWDKVTELAANYSTVLVDSYLAPPTFYDLLSSHFEKVIVIDDYNRIPYKADILINPNVSFYEVKYSDQKATIVGGEEYVILRKAFREKVDQKPVVGQTVQQAVISLGGSDIRNLIPKLVTIVHPLCEKIIVVTGNNNLQQSLQATFQGIDFRGFLSAEEMYDVFSEGDIVISACGQTLHELASMGKTVVGICLDHDQEPNMNYYYRKGFLTERIYWNDPSFERKIISIFKQLEHYDLRKEKYSLGSHLINDQGLANIYKISTK